MLSSPVTVRPTATSQALHGGAAQSALTAFQVQPCRLIACMPSAGSHSISHVPHKYGLKSASRNVAFLAAIAEIHLIL